MKALKTLSIIIAAELALCTLAGLSSCKKDDEETETLPYLDGTVEVECDKFINPGTTIEFPRPTGVRHPENKGYGIKWRVTPGMELYDTTKTEDGSIDTLFKYTFPDSLGTFTVVCAAYADKYYSISASKNVTTVLGGYDGSLQYRETPAYDNQFTDSRDGSVYRYMNIGGTLWMQRNLHYRGTVDEPLGKVYSNSEAMCDVTGVYYNFEDAKKACPAGWGLPTLAQWTAVKGSLEGVAGDFLAYARLNEDEIIEWWPEVNVTNSTGLSIVFFGFANMAADTFDGMMEKAAFWTADEVDTRYAKYVYFLEKHSDILVAKGDKESFGATVRCVKTE